MSWPRLAGLDYRLTPEHHVDPLEWRHTTVVTRRPHRRVEKMRHNLHRVVLGPPPQYEASRVVDITDEDAMRRFADDYRAAVRRRFGDRFPDRFESINAQLLDRGADKILRFDLTPRRTP